MLQGREIDFGTALSEGDATLLKRSIRVTAYDLDTVHVGTEMAM
jgi:hypothetical protein